MNPDEVRRAIERARPGIAKYVQIMAQFGETDVSSDKAFQTLFNSFYRVRQRTPIWYQKYYYLMQLKKGHRVTFTDVLENIHRETGRCEPSFSSKLLATLQPERPIWDSQVLQRIGVCPPSYRNPERLSIAPRVYDDIIAWYRAFMDCADARLILNEFDSSVPQHTRISNTKKIDFVLWQMRA